MPLTKCENIMYLGPWVMKMFSSVIEKLVKFYRKILKYLN